MTSLMNSALTSRADNLRGAGYMVISMAAFVVNDALMKSLAGEIPLFQAIFLRGLVAMVLIGTLAIARGAARPSALAPADRWPALIRVCAEIGTTTCFLTALFNMPLANATAILQSTPLALTMVAALFLRERVGWRRWTAVFIGFLGVMLIVRPGAAGFNDAAYWALGAVGFIIVRDLATKRLSPATPSLAIALMTAVAITCLGGGVTVLNEWAPVAPVTFGILALSACFLFVGYLFSVMTMRIGDMGFVSPFRYTILIWALILGAVVFGEIPDEMTLAGAAIIAGTGLYTFYRERQRR
jgi:drug/metabolite transporter (DMT)-like permease